MMVSETISSDSNYRIAVEVVVMEFGFIFTFCLVLFNLINNVILTYISIIDVVEFMMGFYFFFVLKYQK